MTTGNSNKGKIGIIGGSGVYDIDGLKNKQWVKVGSAFGDRAF